MKCMFDTNVYISFLRDRSYSSELQRRGTVKYLSAEDKTPFQIIKNRMPSLKVAFI